MHKVCPFSGRRDWKLNEEYKGMEAIDIRTAKTTIDLNLLEFLSLWIKKY